MIVLDVETTGLDMKKNSIVSIGAVDFSSPSNMFYKECKIREGSEIDPYALKVNGFTVEQVTDPKKETPQKIIGDFVEWSKKIEDKTIAGQCVYLDMYYLFGSFAAKEVQQFFGYRVIDMHSLAYYDHLLHGFAPPIKDGKSDMSANRIFMYVGIGKEPDPHNALTGAKMNSEAISRMLYGKNLLDEFKEFEIPDYLKK